MSDTAVSLLRYLQRAPSAVRSREIESDLDISGAAIRDAVNELRKNGYPVCSGRAGYWIAQSNAEIASTIENLKHRVAAIESAIAGLEPARLSRVA